MEDDKNEQQFIEWLKENSCTVSHSISLRRLPETGRGIIGAKDIKEGEVLFELSRSILLSSRNSSLADFLKEKTNLLQNKKNQEENEDDWEEENEDDTDEWMALSFSMMYEYSLGKKSKWFNYFNILPRQLSTPLFWNEKEIQELQGTSVYSKIGLDKITQDYKTKIEPLIKKYGDKFKGKAFTIETYLWLGSIIMAYSFLDQDIVSMVPMADMLNHKTGHNNARLFYEDNSLGMIATKTITVNEEIYNTYGDLSNSELLRRYGFVDNNNPFDIVEIEFSIVLDVAKTYTTEVIVNKVKNIIEEEEIIEDDDCFVIETDAECPEDLLLVLTLFSKDEELLKIKKNTESES